MHLHPPLSPNFSSSCPLRGPHPRSRKRQAARAERPGPSCSPGCSSMQSTAAHPAEATEAVRITHPFHPLCGQALNFVDRRHQWGEDRVFYRNRHGHLASLPAGWTSMQPEDPFVVVGAGRSRLRVDDLLELAERVLRLGS